MFETDLAAAFGATIVRTPARYPAFGLHRTTLQPTQHVLAQGDAHYLTDRVRHLRAWELEMRRRYGLGPVYEERRVARASMRAAGGEAAQAIAAAHLFGGGYGAGAVHVRGGVAIVPFGAEPPRRRGLAYPYGTPFKVWSMGPPVEASSPPSLREYGGRRPRLFFLRVRWSTENVRAGGARRTPPASTATRWRRRTATR
jgi:hypothetical protein